MTRARLANGFERWRDRFLSWPGHSGPDAASQIVALYRILFIGILCELSFEYANVLPHGNYTHASVLFPPVALGCTVVFWRDPTAAAPFALLAGALWLRVALAFPGTANHQYLEATVFSLGALLHRKDLESEQLLEQTIRWLVVLILTYSGIQKIVHGQYFDGQFLGFMASQRENYAAVLQFAMPAEELARLQGIPVVEGAGPFRVNSTPFVVISNLAYGLEVLSGLALLVPRLRLAAVACALALLVGIESAARELFFGGFMVALLLLAAERKLLTRAFPVFALFYLYLFSMFIGILPRWTFH